MEKKARARVSPLAVLMPIGVCAVIGCFTYAVAERAGITTGLAATIAGVIGLLWFIFFVGRLVEQTQR